MKERPILFSGPLVRAILEGRKVQTRRPVDEQRLFRQVGDFWPLVKTNHDYCARVHGTNAAKVHGVTKACPFGVPGDRLWVRENWAEVPWLAGAEKRLDGDRGIRYQATWGKAHAKGWKPSIHMKREASRLTLEVTDVRVQRLQDITEEEAIAEGVEGDGGHPVRGCLTYPGKRDAFFQVWEDIYGKTYPFASKPWVWAVSFKVAEASR
jgi:hypothetical protein